jgi:hypothetical protein
MCALLRGIARKHRSKFTRPNYGPELGDKDTSGGWDPAQAIQSFNRPMSLPLPSWSPSKLSWMVRKVRSLRDFLRKSKQNDKEMGPEVSTKDELSEFPPFPKGQHLRIGTYNSLRWMLSYNVEIPGSDMEYYWIVMSVKRKYLVLFCKFQRCRCQLTPSQNVRSRLWIRLQHEHFVGRLPQRAVTLRANWDSDFVVCVWHCGERIGLLE